MLLAILSKKKAINGEKSIPILLVGKTCLIGLNIGSVTLYIKLIAPLKLELY